MLYLRLLVAALFASVRARRYLVLENLALRHQLTVYTRGRRRPRLRRHDRRFWSLLARGWSGWRGTLVMVEPDTVVRWHRSAWRAYWRWKSRRGPPCSSLSTASALRRDEKRPRSPRGSLRPFVPSAEPVMDTSSAWARLTTIRAEVSDIGPSTRLDWYFATASPVHRTEKLPPSRRPASSRRSAPATQIFRARRTLLTPSSPPRQRRAGGEPHL